MGYFDYIIRQQEAKDREITRQAGVALSLLTMEMKQEWELNTMLLQDARNASRLARASLDETMAEYSTTAGGVPDLSSNAKELLNASYQGEVDNMESMINFYDDKAVTLERENTRIKNQLISSNIEAKKEFAIRFPEYVGKNVVDEMLDPTELEMLLSDLAKESNKNKIKSIATKIQAIEGGSRAERTNNPGAMIYSDWQKDYGAVKSEENAFWQYRDSSGNLKEVFSEEDIPSNVEAKKYYTSEFPDKASGKDALNQLVADIWGKSEGKIDKFVESYSGLDPDTEAFKGYVGALESIDLLDSSDLISGAIRTEYYSTPIEQRMAHSATARLSRAEQELNRSNIGFQMLQGLQDTDAQLFKMFGGKKDTKRRHIEVALSQGSVEAFYSYIKSRPKLEKFIIEKLKSDTSLRARKFKSFFSQTMKAMDKSINLKYPSQNVGIADDLIDYINTDVSVDDAIVELMTLSSGLSNKQAGDLYEDFEEAMIDRHGSSVKGEIEKALKLLEEEPEDSTKILDPFKKYPGLSTAYGMPQNLRMK